MSSPPLFNVADLRVRPVDEAAACDSGEILHGIDLTVGFGEVHVIMGPNGSGKSTLAAALMGSAEYEVTAGSVTLLGDDVTEWPVDERAKAGMFIAVQRPEDLPGVSVAQLLLRALSVRAAADVSVRDLRLAITERMHQLGLGASFVDRHLDDGLSGGERKRTEIVQMAILEPELAILDDIGAGLDNDAIRTLAQGISDIRSERESMGLIVITNDRRLLDELEADRVHVMIDGRIVRSGDVELADDIERDDEASFRSLEPSGSVN